MNERDENESINWGRGGQNSHGWQQTEKKSGQEKGSGGGEGVKKREKEEERI